MPLDFIIGRVIALRLGCGRTVPIWCWKAAPMRCCARRCCTLESEIVPLGGVVHAVVDRTVYIANKYHYKSKTQDNNR